MPMHRAIIVAALILALAGSAGAECARTSPRVYLGVTVTWICLSTDVLPDSVSAGDGVAIVNTSIPAIVDPAAWWRSARLGVTGVYSSRQRPRVTIAPPAATTVDGASAVTLDSSTLVPVSPGFSLADTPIDTFAWTSVPAVGAFAAAAAADTTWTAPAATAAAQVVTLTLTATENYTVAAGGNISGAASLTITVNPM